MSENVPVRCPACQREHVYAAPSYPCVCGAPVTPVLDRSALPEPVTHHTWDEGWVTIRCGACGRADHWPRPELGCPCGVLLRIPVTEPGAGDDAGASGPDAAHSLGAETGESPEGGPHEGSHASSYEGSHEGPCGSSRDHSGPPPRKPRASRLPAAAIPLPRTAPAPRPAFQPVVIRTARDAVTAAALYLRWLGYRDIRRADQRPPSGIGLAARGILAQVDPTVRPASLRDVECLWLTAMTESAGCVYFSLAGYEEDARVCADSLGIPLFVLDLTGTPQPVNSLADDLIATGD
ncbi:hypothetical protein QF035_002733 [Streptomyces umbrinus]|uniref:Restriction endonuclease type IV Mrr domain-containing protein n=1 Tax=Streptomyces umbrinus TaxID=67370 RepID=A0ABU0SR20_9ACTN|nr:hypothetical protein [Streptomyces umbrinus]MDQ1025151.1 hypothetical protein [Streptomyces umbrinus]